MVLLELIVGYDVAQSCREQMFAATALSIHKLAEIRIKHRAVSDPSASIGSFCDIPTTFDRVDVSTGTRINKILGVIDD